MRGDLLSLTKFYAEAKRLSIEKASPLRFATFPTFAGLCSQYE
jgi:hypothetical protein